MSHAPLQFYLSYFVRIPTSSYSLSIKNKWMFVTALVQLVINIYIIYITIVPLVPFGTFKATFKFLVPWRTHFSPCSYRRCGTSVRCKHWPLNRDLGARRTAWTRGALTDPKDTRSWTSCTRGASRRPVDRPRCSLWSSPCLKAFLYQKPSRSSVQARSRWDLRVSQTHDSGAWRGRRSSTRLL